MHEDRPETEPSQAHEPSGANSRGLTWAALLGKWTEFAKAATALPDDAEGRRWRAGVPAIISLQAVTLALGELDRIPDAAERAAGIDRAEVVIRKEIGRLHEIWSTNGMREPLPEHLTELIEDARRALNSARQGGTEWIVATDQLVAPNPIPTARRLLEDGRSEDFFAARPGTVLFRGEPLAFLRSFDAPIAFPGCSPRRASGPHQIYRQVDEGAGRVARDLVVPFSESLPPGQPLLAPIIEGGELVARFDEGETARWSAAQRMLLGDRAAPVSWERDDPSAEEG